MLLIFFLLLLSFHNFRIAQEGCGIVDGFLVRLRYRGSARLLFQFFQLYKYKHIYTFLFFFLPWSMFFFSFDTSQSSNVRYYTDELRINTKSAVSPPKGTWNFPSFHSSNGKNSEKLRPFFVPHFHYIFSCFRSKRNVLIYWRIHLIFHYYSNKQGTSISR